MALDDAPDWARFQSWYSTYASMFQDISQTVCNDTLQAYYVAYSSGKGRLGVGDTCDLHVDCMLENTRESVKSTIASAAIFLSLVPTIMSMLGPSLTQLAMLSARRPVLSFLLSVGSSEFYLDRLFRVESPQELLSLVNGERLFPRLKGSKAILMSVGEYTLAGLAVANVVHNSWRLGNQTVVGFVCKNNFFPLVWTLSLPCIFLCVAIPFQFSSIAKRIRQRTHHRRHAPHEVTPQDSLEPPPAPGRDLPRTDSATKQFVTREMLPSLHHPPIPSKSLPNFETWATILLNAAAFVAAVHVLIGICFFSSIIFISVTDAIEVTLRYLVSAAACRLVVMLEFGGMKAKMDSDEDEPMMEAVVRGKAT